MNQVIKELWDDYKKAVKTYGYGAESERILFKIYEVRDSLAPSG